MDEDEGVRELFRALRRRGLFVVAAAAVGAVLGLVSGLAVPVVYTSEAFVSFSVVSPAATAAADSLPGSQIAIALPPGAALLAAQRAAAVGVPSAAPAGVAVEASVDEKRGVFVVRAASASPDRAREGAEAVASAARAAIADGTVAALRSQTAQLLASTRLEVMHTRRALAAARALLEKSPAARGTADPAVAEALEARRVSPSVARAGDPGDAWLRIQTAHLALQEALFAARIASLEELERDPEPLVSLGGQRGSRSTDAGATSPVPRPRGLAKRTAGAAALGLLAGLAAVFFREA